VLLSRRQDDVDLIANESNVPDLPNFQAFVDLQKAAWIVYEVIIGDEEVKEQMGDEEKRLLCDVIDVRRHLLSGLVFQADGSRNSSTCSNV
jgi:hypothetical protein